mmetsp:Transcript_6575/g.19026  ORF Transcript_6575/g.19026 Transcript_6575/m.19026 type:complete len:348 (-) Transcript_6575:1941-2984(-)
MTAHERVNTTGMAHNGKVDDFLRFHIVQEFDAADNMVFEWRSIDHFSTDELMRWTAKDKAKHHGDWDLMHMNALSWTPDGHLLLSLPRVSGAIKVSRETGEVMWRMFGRHPDFNDFAFDPPLHPPISHQHDVRFSDANTLTLFANGMENDPEVSRALEFAIDEDTRTAHLVFNYSDGRYSMLMGSTQRLGNGNMAIGWGGLNLTGPLPFYTEVTRQGEIVLEMQLENDGNSYRTRKHKWRGEPRWPPLLVLDTNQGQWSDDRPPRLHYSWNGATEVAQWRVYAGSDPRTLEVVAGHPRRRFEHSIDLWPKSPFHPSGCVYYQVEPLGSEGKGFIKSAVLASPACTAA